MKITCVYLEGCPSRSILPDRVQLAVTEEGVEAEIEHTTVTALAGVSMGIAGSPTVLLDGIDFAGSQEASLA